MARGPSMFRQTDLTKALKAALAAGLGVVRCEIEANGKIVVVTSPEVSPGPRTEFDKWKQSRARTS